MKYCTQCGGKLNDDARFCSHCGTSCARQIRRESAASGAVRSRTSRGFFSGTVIPFLAGTAIGSVLVRMLGGHSHGEAHAAEGKQEHFHETLLHDEEYAGEYNEERDDYGIADSFAEDDEWEAEDDWENDAPEDYETSGDYEDSGSDYGFYDDSDSSYDDDDGYDDGYDDDYDA